MTSVAASTAMLAGTLELGMPVDEEPRVEYEATASISPGYGDYYRHDKRVSAKVAICAAGLMGRLRLARPRHVVLALRFCESALGKRDRERPDSRPAFALLTGTTALVGREPPGAAGSADLADLIHRLLPAGDSFT